MSTYFLQIFTVFLESWNMVLDRCFCLFLANLHVRLSLYCYTTRFHLSTSHFARFPPLFALYLILLCIYFDTPVYIFFAGFIVGLMRETVFIGG